MQTSFTLDQLRDPATAESERIVRTCTHCGFCTATCPSYVLLGDELDSPRGRIYLIKDMLEHDRPATAEVVKHIDRCLSCLACMTTCPAGVHYMHLVDHARVHIERTYRRPAHERLLRALLAKILPNPARFRLALWLAWPARWLAPLLSLLGLRSLAALSRLIPATPPAWPKVGSKRRFPAIGERKGRVAILSGCVNQVLAPAVNQAAIGLLNRHGIEVVVPQGEGCCGALTHHLGREGESLDFVRRNIDVWARHDDEGLRFSAAQRPCLCEKGGAGRRVDERRVGISGHARPDAAGARRQPRGRLSFGLLAAARPEGAARAQGIAGEGRIRSPRRAGGTSVLRIGRNLQHASADNCS